MFLPAGLTASVRHSLAAGAKQPVSIPDLLRLFSFEFSVCAQGEQFDDDDGYDNDDGDGGGGDEGGVY